MLYIVQLITAETLGTPRIFTDREKAQTTFVALVREHCATDYAAYCTRNALEPEAFSAASAFAGGSSGQASKRFGYWELLPEAEGVDTTRAQLPAERREPILRAAVETQKQSLTVQTELRGLTEKLTGLSQELLQLQTLLGEGGAPGVGETAAMQDMSSAKPAEIDEKYQTAEWQDFIQSLIRMCGGNRAEFPLLSRQDWRQAVYGNLTTLAYWEWVALRVDQAIERAKAGGYAVEEAGEGFLYLTPAGERSAGFYEVEDLAWCAAGLLDGAVSDPPA